MADSCIVSDSGTDGKTMNLVMIVQYTKIDLARLFRMKYQIQSFHGIGWKGKSPASTKINPLEVRKPDGI